MLIAQFVSDAEGWQQSHFCVHSEGMAPTLIWALSSVLGCLRSGSAGCILSDSFSGDTLFFLGGKQNHKGLERLFSVAELGLALS